MKNNVIDFEKARRNRRQGSIQEHIQAAKNAIFEEPKPIEADPEVIDFTERRQQIMDIERRTVTRTILSQFIGVFVVLPDKGLQPVVLHDVSEGGIAYDLPTEMGGFNLGDNVTLRIYLSHDTYFSFSTKVVNRRQADNEGVIRHGTAFRKNDVSFKTLFYFTKFLENVSLIARKDDGDRILGRVE